VILGLAALLPFAPAAWQLLQRGIPDLLFTGDGAALELRVLHATRSVQLLGPYSLFGWSHPGPAYFYLALPFYEAAGERGPALNLFAFIVNAAAALGIVYSARRQFGSLTAFAIAALTSVYLLVGAPFVITNEWNPILPILPFALLTVLTVPLALGESRALPIVAFLASAIVQTHVGFGAPIAALFAVALVAHRMGGVRSSILKKGRIATVVVLAVCWALPIYEALTARPGNIQWLIEFFAPDNLAKQTWTVAWTAMREQLAVLPLALVRTVGVSTDGPPRLQTLLLVAQGAALLAIVLSSVRNRDRGFVVLGVIPLALFSVSILAVRAIRQEVEFYLVAWISVIGLITWIVFIAYLTRWLESRFPKFRPVVAVSAVVWLLAALSGPVLRPPVFRERDVATEALTGEIDAFLLAHSVGHPLIRIESRETWPIAVATVLHLYKRKVPVYVEDRWLYIVGKQFTAPAGRYPELRFISRTSGQTGSRTTVADSDDVTVYFVPPS